MKITHAIALYVDQNRDKVHAEFEEFFRGWKIDGASNERALANSRADLIRWIEDEIGLDEDLRAAYDQLQDEFTMRAFMGGVEKIAAKLTPFYGDADYAGTDFDLPDHLIKDDHVAMIGANRPGKLHPVQMADLNERAGYTFFGDDEMKIFQSRIETWSTAHGVFITSERFDTAPRHYRVRVILESGDVVTVSEEIGTLERARGILRKVDARIARNSD